MRDEYNFSQGKRGAAISSKGKTRITIYLDDEILESFRERSSRNRLSNFNQLCFKISS